MTKNSKIIIAIVVGVIIVAFISVGSFFTYKIYNCNKNVEKGLELIEDKQYTESILYFDNAIDGKINTKKAKKIKAIVENYLSAKELFDAGQIDDADEVVKDIDSDYSEYSSLEEDIDNLKKQIEDAKISAKVKEAQDQQPVKEKTVIVQQPQVVQPKVGQKQYYLNYLDGIAADDVDQYEGSTVEIHNFTGERYEIWDKALNEIYGVIKGQLSKSEADKLTQDELEWIKYKEETAEEEGLQFDGGSFQPVQINITATRITKERCYELVNRYMK